jgi:hypothetical protein
MGVYAASYTKGFQFQGGDENSTKYLTGILTLKHYVANSLENTIIDKNITVDGQDYVAGNGIGRHTVDVKISNSMLQEYLAGFRAAAKAGAKGMVCARIFCVFRCCWVISRCACHSAAVPFDVLVMSNNSDDIVLVMSDVFV